MAIEILDKGACRAFGIVSTDQLAPGCQSLGIASADYSGGTTGRVELILERPIDPAAFVALSTVQIVPFTVAGPIRIGMVDQTRVRIETYDTQSPAVLEPKNIFFAFFSLDGLAAATIIPPP